MICTLLGVGHGQTKKDNRAFTVLHYSYCDARVEGQAVDKSFIYDGSAVVLPVGVVPGDQIDLQFNQNGFLTEIRSL